MPPILRATLLCSVAFATANAPAKAAATKPNVVLVITDDQGYGDLHCHGNPYVRTPNLDHLHAISIRFTNFHVSPTCTPTRAALLTGRYPNATGAWHTIMGRSLLAPEEVTLAECFLASGYRTAIFGKWHLGDNYPLRPQDQGFEVTLVHGGGGIWQTPDFFGNDYFDDTYLLNGRPQKFRGFCTDVWFSQAIEFMAACQRRGEPFFCYIATNAPHSPYWAPEQYLALYRDIKGLRDPGFYAMITNIDDNMGKLMDFLETSGLEQNTILIFTTDNGTAAGHSVFNAGMRGAKGSPYEGGHRVPFFIRWPKGGLVGPRDIDILAAHIDILPTLIELCELRRPAGPPLHGQSLRPLLYERSPRWPERVIVVDSQRLDELVKWRQAAVMTQRWRLVNPSPDGDPSRLELYDITQDPGQQHNVIARYPQVVSHLMAEYERWWQSVSVRAEQYVRIVIGCDAENPVKLTCHDWHGDGAAECWNQAAIPRGPAVNGFWAVRIAQSGWYRFELRRWPKELDLPLSAPYHDPEPNRESTPGRAIPIRRARLKIAAFDRAITVGPLDRAAVFDVYLSEGPHSLQTWFYAADGSERGAYYVYVERLSTESATTVGTHSKGPH